jgi:hypothetical protein
VIEVKPLDNNSELRYIDFSTEALEREQALIESYQDEIIQQYGLDFTYFRREHDFIVPDGDINKYSDPIYGESVDAPYTLEMPVRAHLQVNSDEFLMAQLGMSTVGSSYTVSFMVKRFQEALRSRLGKEVTSTFTTEIEYELTQDDILNNEFAINTTIGNEAVSGKISSVMRLDGDLIFSSEMIQDSIAVNDAFITPDYYTGIYDTSGTISGQLVRNGNIITGTVTGDITYHIVKGINQFNPSFEIQPQVGDVLRLDNFTSGGSDNNIQEFEITRIRTSDLSSDDMNQLLASNVIFRCDLVRRSASHEDMQDIDGNLLGDLAEFETEDINNIHTQMIEDESNDLIDYETQDIDKLNTKLSNDVYGGY